MLNRVLIAFAADCSGIWTAPTTDRHGGNPLSGGVYGHNESTRFADEIDLVRERSGRDNNSVSLGAADRKPNAKQTFKLKRLA